MGFALSGSKRWIYHITTVAIAAGLILSIVSWFNMCTEECGQAHKYRIFGLRFETIGIPFFLVLLGCHLCARSNDKLGVGAIILAAAGLGAEVMFILFQKYVIGSWCPVCLSIAACMAVTALCYSISYFQELTQSLNPFYKGEYMKLGWRGIASLSAFAFGFLFAFVGIGKENELSALQDTIVSELWFGNKSSNVEVYLFTDWSCPACRKLEPVIDNFLPEVTKQAKFMFVDYPLHPETYNYSPFNVAFIVRDKQKYLQIRHALSELSLDTGSPTEEQVQNAVRPLGIQYRPLNFADVTVASKYYKDLSSKYDIDATPIMVIVNTRNMKGKKLSGDNEITTPNVLRTVASMQ